MTEDGDLLKYRVICKTGDWHFLAESDEKALEYRDRVAESCEVIAIQRQVIRYKTIWDRYQKSPDDEILWTDFEDTVEN